MAGCSCRDQPVLIVATMSMGLEQAILVMLIVLVFLIIFMALIVAANELSRFCCSLGDKCSKACANNCCTPPVIKICQTNAQPIAPVVAI